MHVDVDGLGGAVLEEDAAGVEFVESGEGGAGGAEEHHGDFG